MGGQAKSVPAAIPVDATCSIKCMRRLGAGLVAVRWSVGGRDDAERSKGVERTERERERERASKRFFTFFLWQQRRGRKRVGR